MAKKKRPPEGLQAPIIPRIDEIPQASFSLDGLDKLISSLGASFTHWQGMPSPIGLRDRGDLRRPGQLDTISENGFIYKKAGEFTGVLQSNSRKQSRADAGFVDTSTMRITMPRFYDVNGGLSNGERIRPCIGDRIYLSNPQDDTLVPNYQRMTYEVVTHDFPMFPIEKIEMILDSQNNTFIQGIDYNITSQGNICWLSSGRNPGIDPETKKGRVYAIRYLYRPFYYIVDLPHEVRMIQVTKDNYDRSSERAPTYVLVQREYLYANRNNSIQNKNENNQQLQPPMPQRTVQAPTTPMGEPAPLKVDMADFYNPSDDDNL